MYILATKRISPYKSLPIKCDVCYVTGNTHLLVYSSPQTPNTTFTLQNCSRTIPRTVPGLSQELFWETFTLMQLPGINYETTLGQGYVPCAYSVLPGNPARWLFWYQSLFCSFLLQQQALESRSATAVLQQRALESRGATCIQRICHPVRWLFRNQSLCFARLFCNSEF